MTTRLMTRRNAVAGVGALALAAPGTRLAAAPARTGKVAVSGGSVTYWIMGDGRGVPILMVHGGPGGSHLHLTPLAALGKDRPVVFWDQLDCGESDHPHNPANWTIDRYVSEIDSLRDALGLAELHILGSSYGGLFAAEYAARAPKGLKSCILAGPEINNPQWFEDCTYLVKLLPEDVAGVILKNEAAGTIEHNEAYDQASNMLLHRHMCRADPWPADFQKAFDTWNLDVEIAMVGPYWTRPGGAFGAYDGTPKLARIKVPSLLTYGQFDFALGGQMCGYHQMINGSTLYQTKDGSHQPWFEFAEDYNRRVTDFLAPLG
jgi:proline iminopeptidase